jgi:hypothetical protein
MRTIGGFVDEYPVTTPVIEIDVTIPDVIDETAVEVVVPIPIGFWIVTLGADSYPKPPFTTSMEVIVPAIETIEVALADTLESWEINVTLFWKSSETVFSFDGLKNGLRFSTYTIVDPTPTG